MAQVRLIFQPAYRKGEADFHYAYVEYFDFTSRDSNGVPKTEADYDMFLVKRARPRSNNVPKGDVILLSDLWQPVELVPKFGNEADRLLTPRNVLTKPNAWYLNNFWNKHCYQTIY